MKVENYYLSYKELFDSIITHQFPREKNGMIVWEDCRYCSELYLMWDTYYNKLIDVEKMVVLLHNIQDYNTILRITHHRMKFILRL